MTIVKVIPMPGIPGPQGPTGPQGPQGPQGPSGEGGNIADFIFTGPSEETNDSAMTISNHDMVIRTTRDDDQDADIDIVSADDIWITAEGDEIEISANNNISIITDMFAQNNTWQFTDTASLNLPNNGSIYNEANSSGDGLGFSTITITPDKSLETHQFLIIDPTAPNHIHIRAGGNIDESGADLFLGGEKNNVVVSDSSRDVYINTRPDMVINSYTNLNEVNNINFIVSDEADIGLDYTVNVDGTDYIVNSVTPDGGLIVVTASGAVFTAGQSYTFTYNPPWTNSWEFGSNGYLYGPAEGQLKIQGIYGGATGSFVSQDSKLITVTNGIITGIEVIP